MGELTATIAEAHADFSKIASMVNATGKPVTVLRNSKPWVIVTPVGGDQGGHAPFIDWSKHDVVRMDEATRKTTLPADWDDPADEGLYDDLA